MALLLSGCNGSSEPGVLDKQSWRAFCDQRVVVNDSIRKLESKEIPTHEEVIAVERARRAVLMVADKALEEKVTYVYAKLSSIAIELGKVLETIPASERPDSSRLRESMETFEITFPCSGPPPREPEHRSPGS